MSLSIVVPTLDEAAGIVAHLERLQPLRCRGAEVVLVDGGSQDETLHLGAALVDLALVSAPGRAAQMNAGARAARGDLLLFLHADTRLPSGAADLLADLLRDRVAWGRFDLTIEGRHPFLKVVSACVNARSRLSGIATGDQAIFVRRDLFEAVGGYPSIPLMEDVALSRALRAVARPLCLRRRVVTSGRRWERRGVARTILLMWLLRLAFWLGVDPARLARLYA